jgi:hypothetical protein
VCPTSNLCTRAVSSLAEHPLPNIPCRGCSKPDSWSPSTPTTRPCSTPT